MTSRLSADQLIRQSSGWDQLWSSLTADPTATARAGKAFERLTQLYLLTQPEYRAKLKSVWRLADVPARVRGRLRLPGTDEGIDLLAETHTGEFWAVQCKFRSDTASALTYRELSTFTSLAFVTCKGISLAIVAHTCSKPVRKHKLLGHTTEIGLDRWLALGDEGWRAIQAAVAGKPKALKPRKPRPHQVRAIKAAEKHFVAGNAARGRLVMPCGTGKSLTAFWIAQALNPRTILVAVPSLSLIKQSLTDWTREFLAHGEVPDWLCVCSDESTGKLEQDEFVGNTYDLGVDATTRPEEIAEFLGRRTRKRKIIFATYQSGTALAAGAKKAGKPIDLAILDEAHRTVGSKDKSFARLLSDQNIPIRQRLFMTATERIVRGADEDVLSMDDAKVYGERFFQMSFKEAINADPPIICDYKILTLTVSDQTVRELIEENRYLTVFGTDVAEREAQALAAGIALQRAFREHGVRHAISFHRSIRAADEFREQHEQIVHDEANELRPACFHVSSRKTTGERAELMREFRESPSALISNARCLQEGVDIPAVDCVLFADPKQSVVDIVQAAGRAMRPFPGKKFGYIVVPIVVPSAKEFAEFAESTEFKQVARVITALSTQDDRIAEEFRAVAAKQRPTGQIVEISGDVPVGYGITLDELREQIRVRLWSSVGRANWRSFDHAKKFAQTLRLQDSKEWRKFAQSADRPADIPANPDRVYSGKGWTTWGDWLGTGRVATYFRRYLPFAEARERVRGMKFESQSQWRAFAASPHLPPDIPAAPWLVYRGKGWSGLGDWLGTGSLSNRYRFFLPFADARAFVRGLRLESLERWYEYAKGDKRPKNIPSNPQKAYERSGWLSFGDWLGIVAMRPRKRTWRPFSEARAFVRKLLLRNEHQWRAYCSGGEKPEDIPAHPSDAYRNDGWAGMGDWLGTGNAGPRHKKFKPFAEARDFARSLGLRTKRDWVSYLASGRKPANIPANPDASYRDKGWISFSDWLGTEHVPNRLKKMLPFSAAREFARSLSLSSVEEWRTYATSGKRPADLPGNPQEFYAENGWGGWGDFLGTGRVSNRDKVFRSFMDAREFIRGLGLKSESEWREYCRSGKRPSDIPSHPDRAYKSSGWAGMADWLGNGQALRRRSA